jgi:hypothetical protein
MTLTAKSRKDNQTNGSVAYEMHQLQSYTSCNHIQRHQIARELLDEFIIEVVCHWLLSNVL